MQNMIDLLACQPFAVLVFKMIGNDRKRKIHKPKEKREEKNENESVNGKFKNIFHTLFKRLYGLLNYF